jgi:hypothetical protein
MFMKHSFHPVDLPNLPPLTHLSLRINGHNCENFVAGVVRRCIPTLTHLELYPCGNAEIQSTLSSRLLNLQHLICIDHPPGFNAEVNDYLDNILPSLIELRSLVLGTYRYTGFSFIDELPRLRELAIVVEQACLANPELSLLFLDLESRLAKNRLTSINISIHTRSARWFSQDHLSPLHLLSKACEKLGIKFKVVVFDTDADSNHHRRQAFQVAAAKRR